MSKTLQGISTFIPVYSKVKKEFDLFLVINIALHDAHVSNEHCSSTMIICNIILLFSMPLYLLDLYNFNSFVTLYIPRN